MEINNFLFICLINLTIKNKKIIFFYFIIQISASFIIIFRIILNNIFLENYFLKIIFIIRILIKLAIPPFHFWFPLISIYMPWITLFILITIQKLTPFYILSLIKIHSFYLYLILIICSILPPYIISNLTNLKILLTYSSINQSGWIFILIYFKNIIWIKYFSFYSLILIRLRYFIYNFKIYKNLNNFYKLNFNIITLLFIFNVAGLPPFTLFYLKWYSIFIFLINSNILILLILLIVRSLIILYIYSNIITNSLFLFKIKSKLLNYSFNHNIKKITIIKLSRIFILPSFLLIF